MHKLKGDDVKNEDIKKITGNGINDYHCFFNLFNSVSGIC